MEFNLFKTVEDDFQSLVKNFGQDIKVNNVDMRAVITNTTLNDFDTKYISSSEPLKRGDHVIYDNKEYYVITEAGSKRYEAFKAVIRHCEHRIRFNVSTYTATKKYTAYDVKEFPAIVSTSKELGLSFISGSGLEMYLPDGQLSIVVQDNEDTRKVYQAVTDSSSSCLHNIIFSGRSWKINGADISKSGLISFNVEADTFKAFDDKEAEISWNEAHANWSGDIDDSFYTSVNDSVNDNSIDSDNDNDIW